MAGITIDDLDNIFIIGNYAIEKAAANLGRAIFISCPESRERSLAITKLREAIMWANAAIACNDDDET